MLIMFDEKNKIDHFKSLWRSCCGLYYYVWSSIGLSVSVSVNVCMDYCWYAWVILYNGMLSLFLFRYVFPLLTFSLDNNNTFCYFVYLLNWKILYMISKNKWLMFLFVSELFSFQIFQTSNQNINTQHKRTHQNANFRLVLFKIYFLFIGKNSTKIHSNQLQWTH